VTPKSFSRAARGRTLASRPGRREAGSRRFRPAPLRAWAAWSAAALGAAASVFALLAAPPPALAQGPDLAAVQIDLARQMRLAGASSSAYVYDLTTKQALFSAHASVMRPPASVEKLYTATAALALMGPTARLSTSVLGTGQLSLAGVWEGNLYLRGGGDPTFGSSAFIRSHYGGLGASVSALAYQLRQAGIRAVSGSIIGDGSLFDARPGEPASGYAVDPDLVGRLSGLAFNRGAIGSQRGAAAPAAYAAQQLRSALSAAGVQVSGHARAGTAPPGALLLANVESPTLAQLLMLTLPPSDNFFAETLLKDLGARFGGAGSTAAGAAVVSRTIAKLLGIHAHILDGSGLSHADRTSAFQVATLLVALAPTALGSQLRSSLAVAGRSGTLAERMRHTAAAGRCQGKTGTLIGASNLAGYCQSANGHLLAFAVFDDGVATTFAHRIQDHIAITLASSSLTPPA